MYRVSLYKRGSCESEWAGRRWLQRLTTPVVDVRWFGDAWWRYCMLYDKIAGGRFEYLYYAGVRHRWKEVDLEELLLGRSVTVVDKQLLLLSARCRDGRWDRQWGGKVMAKRSGIARIFQGERMPHTWGGHAGLNYLGRVLDMRLPSIYKILRMDDANPRRGECVVMRRRQAHRGADLVDRCRLRDFNCTEGWGTHPASKDAERPAWWEL